MADYSEMYYVLFKEISNALEMLERCQITLKEAQLKTERLYMTADESVLTFVPRINKTEGGKPPL